MQQKGFYGVSMILVLCELSTGEETEFILSPQDKHKRQVLHRQYAKTHRVWEIAVISVRDGIYEIQEDYYFIVLSTSEIEHIRKVQRGESIVHHMEYKLRNKNLVGVKGKVTPLGYRVIKILNQFDKSIKQY